MDMLDDVITSSCICGANNRAHKRTCPMSSRAQYPTGRQHRTPKHKPGDYVNMHSISVKDKHLTCRVIECLTKPAANLYRLSCTNDVLTQLLPESDLTKSSSSCFIPLDRWRTSPRVMIRDTWSDLPNLHKCECEIPRAKSTTIDLTDTEPKKETGTPVGSPSGRTMIDLTNFRGSQSTEQTDMPADTPAAWIKNSHYVLNKNDRQLITSPTGWLDDRII